MGMDLPDRSIRPTTSVTLAFVGAALIILGQLVPWGFDQTFALDCPNRTSDCVFNTIEHGGGAIAALIAAIVLLGAPTRWSFGGGLLVGTGLTSAFIWIGHFGYVMFVPGSSLDIGWYAGFVGSVLLVVGGWMAIRPRRPAAETLVP